MIHAFVSVSLLFRACQVAVAQDEYVLNGYDCGVSDPSRRIVNGKQALEEQFPFLVFLKIRFNDIVTRCGGSIITRRHVLTAGHCTLLNDVEASEITVIYGSSDFRQGQRVRGIKLLRHQQFDPPKFHNDIAIVVVEHDFVFGPKVRPICLPTQPVDIFDSDVIVAGWGYLEQDGRPVNNLRYTVVKVLPNARCEKKYKDSGYRKDIMYCAYRFNTDACQGDSGGPLMTQREGRFLQVGIVSYGIGCAVKGMPGVYARMDALMPWLKENIGEIDRFRPLAPHVSHEAV